MSKSRKSGIVLVAAPAVRKFWQDNADLAREVAAEAKVSTNSVLGADDDPSRIRGRVNPAFYAEGTRGGDLLAKAGMTYKDQGKGGVAPVATVEIPRVSPKTGRPVKSTVLPLAEARALAGDAAKGKGILSSAAKARVAEVLAEQGR